MLPPVDRYLAGNEQALSSEAAEGLSSTSAKPAAVGVTTCRCLLGPRGPSFVNTEFRITGVPERGQAALTRDLGRGGVSGLPESDVQNSRHAFKAPTLRNIDKTAPLYAQRRV